MRRPKITIVAERKGPWALLLLWKQALVLVLCLTVLLGCGKRSVVDELTQVEANKIVSLLSGYGLRAFAERGSGGHGVYKVTVADEDYTAAVSLLTAHHLPADKQLSLSELLADGGLIPGSREIEKLRIERARSLQIEQALLSFPGVERAHVVVNAPVNKAASSWMATSPFLNSANSGAIPGSIANGEPPIAQSGEGERGKVAVVIEARPGSLLKQEEVKQLIAAALPGLLPQDVTLSITNHTPSVPSTALSTVGVVAAGGTAVVSLPLVSLFSVRVAGDDALTLQLIVGLLILVSLALGYLVRLKLDRGSASSVGAGALKTGERRSVRIDDHRADGVRSLPTPGSQSEGSSNSGETTIGQGELL
jgi:type III secretory pathway lipoprotein EscJ